MKPPLPKNEVQRLESLRRYQILDTPPEQSFDDLTRLAAFIAGAPMAMVTLIDADRQWFKSKIGVDVSQTPREVAFCAHAVMQDELFVVPDARKDQRFADNPLVTGAPNIRFYAGMPLIDAEGHALGTLCVVDLVPRELAPEQQQALRVLARQVMTQIELRHALDEQTRLAAEHRAAQEQVTHAHATLAAVLNAATQVAVIATGENGIITIFNSGAERMYGYAAAEVVGKQTPHILHHESEVRARSEELGRQLGHAMTHLDVFVEYARQGKLEDQEWTCVRKDGSEFIGSLAVTLLRDANGNVTGFLGITKDITELKEHSRRVEEARRAQEQAALRLAQLVKELEISKQRAEDATRAKSEFLANMSHEIRTPMNAILGMTEMALESKLKPKQQGYLRTVKDSANSLLALINDILDFSKVEAKKFELDHLEFSLRHALVDTLKVLALRAQQQGLGLAVHVRSGVQDALVGDPARLGRILTNLVGNAIKFTKEGEVVVHVRTESQKDPANGDGVMLHFSVTDTGIGIPDDKQERIFEAFAQADSSTTRKYGGTGLGLAITAQLVGLMGGRIWVESAPGLGSTFHFTARFAVNQGAAQGKTPRPGPSAALPPRRSSQGLRILLVEDNPVNQAVAVQLLERRGHSATVANNGREALRALERQSFDAVLMDLQMPELGGLEATRLIREKEKTAGGHIPIIAMTAHAMQEDRERCIAAGMDGYLAKPFESRLLFESVERFGGLVGSTKSPVESGVEKTPSAPTENSAAAPSTAEGMLARAGGDAKFLCKLIDVFLADAPKKMSAIRRAFSQRDADAIAAASHSLKGAVGNFGAEPVMAQARSLEALAGAGDLPAAREAFTKLEQELTRFFRELRMFTAPQVRKTSRRKK